MAVLMALTVIGIAQLNNNRNTTNAAHSISDFLDNARTYALANNTYVWVGFFEEDGSRPSTTPAAVGQGGRLVMLAVASQDGSRYREPVANSSLPALDSVGSPDDTIPLVQIGKIVKLDNVRLVAANNETSANDNSPPRPVVPAEYQLGESPGAAPNNAAGAFANCYGTGINTATFSYPLGASASAQYVFAKIIEFNPLGEASKIGENVFNGPGPQDMIEIALNPTNGGVIAAAYSGANQNKAAAVLQIEGFTGQIRIFFQ